ncbi:MAG TPA: zinc-dependent metalloprotease [Acidimicrobiales bacterium]|nr:zinc-dependent metalloprotease [Acidimicrobiales bacterium]
MDFGAAGGNFLEQLLGDLLSLMGGMPGAGAGSRVDLARTLAQGVATGGQPEPNVDPAARMELEQLVRVAELHVAELTGMSVTASGAPVTVVADTPGAWARRTVEDWRFLLDAMTEAPPLPPGGAPGSPAPGETGTTAPAGVEPAGPVEGLGLADLDEEPAAAANPADLVARFATTMGPMMAALQFGSAVGHLAQTTLGQFEVPVPRDGGALHIVPANLTRFAEQWSLPPDQVGLWVCVRDLTVLAVYNRPGVASRMRELLVSVLRDNAQDAAAMLLRFEGLDPSDPETVQRLFTDPQSLLGDEPLPTARRSDDEVTAAVAALFGYVEHVVELAGTRLLGGQGAVAEAWRRRQVARETNERAAEALLGLDLGPTLVDRGAAFVRGVVDRVGDAGLARLWTSGRTLPTPSELDAPGLWLERIDLDDESTGGTPPAGH